MHGHNVPFTQAEECAVIRLIDYDIRAMARTMLFYV